MLRLQLLWVLVAIFVGGAAVAAELAGDLQITVNGKPLRSGEAQEAVIYFRPHTPVPLTPAAEPALLTTLRKQFVPHLLAVQAGESVRFPNQDVILHNAFSTSPSRPFDTGQYPRGVGQTFRFDQPGLVRVYCNVHHSMFGFILVLDTPFHTRADASGHFRLTDLPKGDGEIVVFHDRAPPLRRAVVVGKTGALQLDLELNQRKIPAHMNKFGKPYSRSPDANY
jgi:hypothetical protein